MGFNTSARLNLNLAPNRYLLEEEVVSDELLLSLWGHAVKRVELASEVTVELVAGLDDLTHDLVALLVGDTRAERVVSKVAADTDTGGLDESGTLLIERWAVKLISVHVRDVLVGWLVTVVVLDDPVEEGVEGLVRVSRAGVAADAGVEVLATREDACLERNLSGIRLVVVLSPDVLGEVLGHSGLAVSGELRPASELVGRFEVGATLGAAGGGVGDTLGGVATHG